MLQMFFLEIGLPHTCSEIALTWFQAKVGLWIHQGSIGNNLENKSYNFSREKIRVWPTGSTTIHQHAKKDVFPKLYEQVCVGEGKNVADDNINHRGARIVFLIMNSIDILEQIKMLVMIRTHLSRDFMKM